MLSHLHWDHMPGLPFFSAGDNDSARVDLYLPGQEQRSGRDLLAQSLSPPAFPINPDGLYGGSAFHAVSGERRDVDGFAVTAVDIEHKGGRTFGWRVDGDGRSMAYLPDHAPAAGVSDELMAMLDDVDAALRCVGLDIRNTRWRRCRRPSPGCPSWSPICGVLDQPCLQHQRRRGVTLWLKPSAPSASWYWNKQRSMSSPVASRRTMRSPPLSPDIEVQTPVPVTATVLTGAGVDGDASTGPQHGRWEQVDVAIGELIAQRPARQRKRLVRSVDENRDLTVQVLVGPGVLAGRVVSDDQSATMSGVVSSPRTKDLAMRTGAQP